MLEVDKYSRVPIYEQIIAEFERIILTEEISLHEAMPSVRSLSQELSVNPNTLQKAYSEMEN
ncbi:MAG: GntR family transcriptional regulator, partial [Clostridia bacterium]|nr:GntR family transcriptional regulator [Clostridia bacterium]